MKCSHEDILKEITDDLSLSLVSGGQGSGDWATGADTVWSAAVGIISGKNCSWPGGFYGPSNPTPTGSGTCVGGPLKPGDIIPPERYPEYGLPTDAQLAQCSNPKYADQNTFCV